MQSSPFVYNRPVTDNKYYNRIKLLKDIQRHLLSENNNGNIWLLAQKNVGKTSTLKILKKRYSGAKMNGRDIKFVDLDCKTIPQKELLFEAIAERINLDLDFGIPYNKKSMDEKTYFTKIFKQVYDKNLYIILLLDGFNQLLKVDNLEDRNEIVGVKQLLIKTRAMLTGISRLKDSPNLVSAVFSSTQHYRNLAVRIDRSSDLNVLELELSWFDDILIRELTEYYLLDDPDFFSDREVELCFEISRGLPVLVQKVLELMYYQKKEKQGKIDKIKLKTETDKFIKKNPSLFSSRITVPLEIVKRLKQLGKNCNYNGTIFKESPIKQ